MKGCLKWMVLSACILISSIDGESPFEQGALLAAQPARQGDDWTLIFSDEFDGASLDADKWVTCHYWGCTHKDSGELQWYHADDVLVSSDVLRLQAREWSYHAPDGKTYDYTSGMVSTGRDARNKSVPAKFAFQYGYVEMRAKIPSGKGFWPAFWLLPDDHTWPPEIDVLEILGHDTDRVYFTLHYVGGGGGHAMAGSGWTGPDFSAGWHTFAVDWQPDAIVWYVDGIERWSYANAANIPARPMFLLATFAVGGDWPGAPDDSTPFPSYYEIDYVRVWKRGYHIFLPLRLRALAQEEQ